MLILEENKMKHCKMFSVWLMILIFINAANGIEVYDCFDRDNSNDIGRTQEVTGTRWVEVGDNSNEDLIGVLNDGTMRFHYFVSSPSGYYLSTNLGGVVANDFDMTVKCKPYSNYYGRYYGFGYRLPNQTSLWPASGGYWVRLNKQDGKISLSYGNSLIAEANVTVPSDFSTLRIVVSGTSHKVYLDNSLKIDITHSGKTNAGYVGLWGYYAVVYWDDFFMTITNTGEQLSDDFGIPDPNETGPVSTGGWMWNEAGDNANNDLISIKDNALYFHYFLSSPSSSSLAGNIRSVMAKDVDVSASFSPQSSSYGRFYGLSYRLSSVNNTYRQSNGYYAQLDKLNGKISLHYNTTKLAEANAVVPDGYSRLRVVASGKNHQVYFYPESFDDFNRADSNSLGNIDGYSWNEVGDNANNNLIKINNNEVRMHYFASTPSGGTIAANINNYKARDVDISVNARPHNTTYGKCYGIAYRLESVNDEYPNNGYYAQYDYQNGTVSLRYGNTVIVSTSKTIPSGYSTLRVTAQGQIHRIYLNDECVLEVEDYRSQKSGYVGIWTSYSIAYFDDFAINGRDVNPVVDIVDTSRLNEGYVGTFWYYSIGSIRDFKVNILPSVKPVGDDFPLMVYTLQNLNDIEKEGRFGWNTAHTYADLNDVLDSSIDGDCVFYANLPWHENSEGYAYGYTQNEIASIINSLEKNSTLSWWNLPEEMKYSRTTEYDVVKNYTDWTRWYDYRQRPNFMYIPGDYNIGTITHYVDYLDVIPAACYAVYYGMPHAWVRWRTEETVRAITSPSYGDKAIGYDYLNDEKFPMSVLELYNLGNQTTPQGAYHDFWQAIVAGARGIGVFSYSYKCSSHNLRQAWDMYCRAASEITGPENLGTVVLSGSRQSDRSVTITSGTSTTPAMSPPYGGSGTVQYSSIDNGYWYWNNDKYLITVNSAIGNCSANISGLPSSSTADVLFEGRTVTTNSSGVLTDSWNALGVHIYKFD
jgi:hypothetical protein